MQLVKKDRVEGGRRLIAGGLPADSLLPDIFQVVQRASEDEKWEESERLQMLKRKKCVGWLACGRFTAGDVWKDMREKVRLREQEERGKRKKSFTFFFCLDKGNFFGRMAHRFYETHR